MRKKIYNIAISCIGSGVGQSIINSIRLCDLPFKTVGFGTNPMAFGAYDCDLYDYTPNIYSDNYIEILINKCHKHKIDLLFPGTDDEVLIFAQNKEKLLKNNVNAIYPEEALVKFCREKHKMGEVLNKHSNIFVNSYSLEEIQKQIKNNTVQYPLIAKPHGGFGSNNIIIIRNENELYKITKNHFIQQLAIPTEEDPNYKLYLEQINKGINPQVSEISIQLVYDRNGNLLGKMSSYNKLKNGIPIEILPFENEEVWNTVNALIPDLLKLGLKGPINIQGRLTNSGFKIFEINPRFTGITGLRALMGFNEVVTCAKEWLDINDEKNSLILNYNRFGIRQTADKVINLDRNKVVNNFSILINNKSLKKRKVVLVTGASGYLGSQIARILATKKEECEVVAVGRDVKKMKTKLKDLDIKYVNYEDLKNGSHFLSSADILLHCGFARPHVGNKEIASSLSTTCELFTLAASNHVPLIINLSSMSVYGTQISPLWNESSITAPESAYAQAKYSTELYLQSLNKIYPHIRQTSLRLSTLAGGHHDSIAIDFISKLIKQAITNSTMCIVNGNQKIERLHVADAANAIARVICDDIVNLSPVYNLGSNNSHKLIDWAKAISTSLIKETDLNDINVQIIQAVEPPSFGMDSNLFYKQFSWKPIQTMENIILDYVNYFKSN